MNHPSLVPIAHHCLTFAPGFDFQGNLVLLSLARMGHLLLLGPHPLVHLHLSNMLDQLVEHHDEGELALLFLNEHAPAATHFRHLPHCIMPASFQEFIAEQPWKGPAGRPFVVIVVEHPEQVEEQHPGLLYRLFFEGAKGPLAVVVTASTAPGLLIEANTTTQIFFPPSREELDSVPGLREILSTSIPQGISHPLLLRSYGKGQWLSSLPLELEARGRSSQQTNEREQGR